MTTPALYQIVDEDDPGENDIFVIDPSGADRTVTAARIDAAVEYIKEVNPEWYSIQELARLLLALDLHLIDEPRKTRVKW